MDKIIPIQALSDNYIWLLINSKTNQAAVVDPGDAKPVIKALSKLGLDLQAIFITHHHFDHIAGVQGLLDNYQVPVYGPAEEKIASVTDPVKEGDVTTIENLQVLDIRAHTSGHVAYYGQGVVFTGDTLFTGGCGRLFEGTAEQMYNALMKLSKLPPETQVYCGHEYTEANLNFAKLVEPNNVGVQNRLLRTIELRKEGKPTVPSTIALENATNPFMRCNIKDVIHSAENHANQTLDGPIEVLAELRQWKDRF